MTINNEQAEATNYGRAEQEKTLLAMDANRETHVAVSGSNVKLQEARARVCGFVSRAAWSRWPCWFGELRSSRRCGGDELP